MDEGEHHQPTSEDEMTRNMGLADRIIRAFVVAPVLVVLAALVGFASVLGVVLVVLAAVMVGTAAVAYCPLYSLFHLHTDHRGGAPA
jgi:fatty acid desaturase